MTRVTVALCALAAVACARAAAAQDPTPLPVLGERAPVVLDGRVLFAVGESGTWSPQQRAARIEQSLRTAADGSEPVHLELAERDGYPIVRMGQWHLLTIAESDVPLGMDAGEQAERWLQTVDAALQRARGERSAAYRVAAAARLLGVFLIAVLLHWGLRVVRRRLPGRIARALSMERADVGAGRPAWQTAIQLLTVLLQIGLWAAVALYACDLFPTARQLRWRAAQAAGEGLSAPLLMLNERGYSSYDLLWLAAAIAVLWVVVTTLTSLVSWRLARATGATRGSLQPMTTLLRYALLIVGLIVVLQVAGLNLSSLAIVASVLGVGIGFGLQNIANNFVSGILVALERPVKPGDFVTLGTLAGVVERIGGRSTIIRTQDRVSIIVPNSKLLETELVNWSYGDPLVRLHVPVGVAYGSNVETVRAALLGAAQVHPVVLVDPRPEVRLTAFGESALEFDLLVWMRDPPGQDQLKSDLNHQIEHNLRDARIEIPFPQRTLHLPGAEIDTLAARLRGDAVPSAPAPMPHPNGNGGDIAFPSAPWRALDIDPLVARMRGADGLAIADRHHLFRTYPRCFIGAEAVEWLMRRADLSRAEAIQLGQRLVESRIIHHVLDEHPFRDGAFFYRFYADEDR